MDLSYSDEQNMLRDSVDRFIKDNYGHDQRRDIQKSEDGFSRAHWRQFAELGWLALPFSEEDGGIGGAPVDMMILMQGLGHGAILEPYLSTVILAGGALRHGASAELRGEVVPKIVEGELILAFAHVERQARFCLSDVGTTAAADGDAYVLTGEKTVVLHAPAADQIVVSARTNGQRRDTEGITLFLVDATAPGVELLPYKTVDGVPAAELSLNGAKVPADRMIGTVGGGFQIIERATEDAINALCAEAVGGMEFLLDATTTYTKERIQFGQPIARFQVLRHRMSDMAMALEEAKSIALYCALTLDSDDPVERAKAASAAKAKIGESARYVSQQAVQLHGAMGVTDEMPVGDFFKRLMAIETLFGNTDHHLARYASLTRPEADALVTGLAAE